MSWEIVQYWFKYSEQLYRTFKKCFHHVHCGPHQLSWQSHHFMSPTVYLSPRWSFGSKSINNLLQLERLFIVIKLQILFYFADNQPCWASFLCTYHCSFSSSFAWPLHSFSSERARLDLKTWLICPSSPTPFLGPSSEVLFSWQACPAPCSFPCSRGTSSVCTDGDLHWIYPL